MRRATPLLRARAALFLALLGLCTAPSLALAQQVNVPPGNSEADQYAEVVPNGGGNGSIDRGLDQGSVAADPVLNALGPDGQAASDLAHATLSGNADEASGEDEGPSSEGMGVAFPILLGLTLLAAIAYATRRRLNPA